MNNQGLHRIYAWNLVVTLFWFTAQSGAQSFDAHVLRIDTNEPDGKAIEAGQQLILGVRSDVSTAVHARVFAGRKENLLAGSSRQSSDGRCWIYDSVVLPTSYENRQLYLSEIPETWLGVGVNDKLTSRRYFMVFETGDLPSGSIKIDKHDVSRYFFSGLHFEVRIPSALITPRSVLAAEIKRGKGSGAALPPLGCIVVTNVGKDEVTLAYKENCPEPTSSDLLSNLPGNWVADSASGN